ncbi:hemagglutinin repeat-containing protein [Nitratireductor sp. PBL-C9]|uniref:hemagglutinin repeat-containing protein n=1 Tax=Nitratireductor sp. PBL-C9 TaxID=3435013 RepID=UPI003D7E7655
MRLDLNGDLSNLGKIISAGTLRLIAADLVANSGLIQSEGQFELKADVLENTGANTKIVSGGGLNIEASARLDNVLGRIQALGPLILRTSGTLTNTSGAIETTGDLHISATDLVNSALAGTDGGTQDVNELGDLNILYATERTSGPARYWGTMRAARDEYSGTIQLNLPGMVRAGGNMRIEGRSLENLDGRILAAGDLSIKMDRTLNDALTYKVDHYRHEWGGGRRFMDNGSGAFHAPVGGHPDWLVSPYSADVFKSAGLDALARGGQRMVVISSGKSPVTVTYAGKGKYQAGVISSGQIEIIENADIASLLDLEALGVDPDNVPSVIMIGNRRVDINSAPYGNHRKTLVGKSTVSVGSLIKSGGDLLLKIDTTTNRSTLAGNLVAIEGGRLNNGAGGDFVLDDVYVPVLDFGPIDALPSWSPDPSDFGRLEAYTGSLEAASLLRDANIAGSGIRFFADPVAEAAAFADAMRRASGRSMTLDGLGDEEARQQLYKNAQAFADATGSRYGVGLTEAQRATLTEPLVWHETRIVDGASVLVPVLYLPPADDLLRGGRGAGLVAGNELVIKLDGRLTNKGAIVAKDLAAVTVRDLLNERVADHGTQFRADGASSGAFGRGDTGLISAGRLLMTTDGDLINRGGAISTAGAMDLRIGGNLVNETMKVKRAVDFMDGCIGKACGTTRTDWNVAQIASGADLTVIVGGDLTNRGGSIGAVNDMLLAAAGEVTFETLQDTYLLKDYRQRGFLSGLKVVEHAITTQEAAAETLLGDMKILAGYSLCDGGDLCRREGAAASDAIFNGAMVSAYGALAVKASGDIDMGTVSAEVVNSYRAWGFQGLGWGSVKRGWNEIDTRGTRLSGDDITLSAGGAIDGVGVKIAAASDLMLLADEDIRLSAAQDARWFTEKGFYIGLSFPGSGAVDAALNRGSTDDVLTGLADLNPLTQSLARLAHADSGLAAGLAAVNTVTGGASVFGGAIRDGYTKFGINGGSAGLTDGLTRGVDPLGKFRGTDGGITPGSVLSTVGLTISSWKKEQGWSESMASELVAGGDVVMRAGLDAVLDQGTKLIAGGDVTVEAERDILMAALVDYARDKSSSFGMSLSPGSLGVNVGKSKGYDEVLTNAGVAAGGDVRLTSGRDTTIAGGNVSGKTVSLDVNRNLAVLSPQAQGWRDGFSFGLSVGLNPSAFSISGSKEDGAKSWSSGSSVIARDSLDVVVREDTLLQGTLLQATDGDILLETGTLTVSDNHDMDRYGNVGGTVGFKGGAVDTVGFSYEKKDRQGETRTTLDAAGMLGVTIRDADRAVAEQLIASVNRDAASWQEVTRDAHTKLSGDLNVRDLAAFSKNAKAIADYVRAVNAIVPDTIAAQGPESVDYFRRLLASGFTTDQAGEALRSPEVQSLVSMQQNWNGAVDFYGSPASVPLAVRVAVAQGVNIDFSQGEPAIRIDCGPYGSGCYFQVMWNGSVDTAGGEQAAIDLVAKAEEDIRRLQPEYAAALELIIFGEPTFENGTRYKAIVAELEQAYFSYLLCADDVGATELSILVEQQIKDYDLGEANRLVDRARERVARVDIRYGGVETADGIFNFGSPAGSVAKGVGKFVVVKGVKGLRTVAGWGVWKEVADYLKAKGGALWSSVGNLVGRTGKNTATVGGKTCVYSCVVDGTTRYVGITDDVAWRGAEHLRTKGIEIEQIAGLDNLSRAEARAVEQTLINYYGLGKDGGTLLNKLNSISATKNPTAYEQSLIRGKELLDSVDYRWSN